MGQMMSELPWLGGAGEPSSKRPRSESESDDDKIDLTATLSDKLLCKVLSHMSLRDKLRSEAVNKKLQRCVLHLLHSKPQPLEICAEGKRLNGYYVSLEQFPDTVRALAAKAKFSTISIQMLDVDMVDSKKWLDSILSALNTSNNQCLSQVNTVDLDGQCSGTVLGEFLANCGKLSNIRLDFEVQPLNNNTPKGWAVALDLASALKDKQLTHLQLRSLLGFSHEQLLQLFGSIKPNTLRKIHLTSFQFPRLNIVGLMGDLSGSAWAALEEIKLQSSKNGDIVPVNFFAALAHLPKLNKCELLLYDGQLAPSVASLFNNSKYITVCCFGCFLNHGSGCQIKDQIGQLQDVLPALDVDFRARKLILKQDEVTFENVTVPRKCDVECAQCHSFYPNVIEAVAKAAKYKVNAHLEGYVVDQCRIHGVVDQINEVYSDDGGWKAMSVETNQEQGTVHIPTKPGPAAVQD